MPSRNVSRTVAVTEKGLPRRLASILA